MLTLANAKSLNEIRRDISLVTLDIESLNHESKEMAIRHLKETIDLLQLGSHNKRVNQDADTEESPEKKIRLDPKNHESIINDVDEYKLTKILYGGLIPSCDLCSSTFVTVGALDTHMKANHADIKQGGENVKDIHNINTIMENPSETIENVDEMYKCDQCDVYLPKSFPFQKHEEDLNHQARIALAGMQVVGEDVSISQITNIEVEIMDPKKQPDITFTCGDCGIKYNNRKSYFEHLNIHSDKFKCMNECQQRFRSLTKLKTHDCKKVTERLKVKESIESGKDTFNCVECGKKYTNKNSYSIHLNVHTDKFKCEGKCQQRFASGFKLNKHDCQKILQNLSVNDCNMSVKSGYIDSGSIQAHDTIELLLEDNVEIEKNTIIDTDGDHEEEDDLEMFSCEVCDKYFVSMESLENHTSQQCRRREKTRG